MTRCDWAVRICCALALLLVAFAHKPLSAQAGPGNGLSAYAGVDVASYTLPDGTLPDLCLDGSGDDHTPGSHHARASSCEACRIVSAVDLPRPCGGFETILLSATTWLPPLRDNQRAEGVLHPGASPRGPPVA